MKRHRQNLDTGPMNSPDVGTPPPQALAALPQGWARLVAEQLEEVGWTAGLLRTLGERLLRAEAPEGREAGTLLVRQAESLARLKEGHLGQVLRIVEEATARRVSDPEWQSVAKALRVPGLAMVTAGRSYAETARRMPSLEGELRKSPGELLLLARLVEERGGQMRRLGERLLSLTEADRMALSSTLSSKRTPGA